MQCLLHVDGVDAMRLQEITAEQYLAILQLGGDAVCTEDAIVDTTEEHFLRCNTLDKCFGESCWTFWASGGIYKHFYTAVE